MAADVEFVVPELAEVLVETADARTGERIPLEEIRYGYREDLELVPGLQSVRFELAPVYAIRFEFCDGEAALPRDDAVYHFQLSQGIRAVDHEGRVTANKLTSDRLVEVSAPGVYEVSLVGVGAGRFHPIMPRRVSVRPGETAEVIVELRRK